nr:MAG TPA: hypothetical protein [Herelleviridae sp.]DAZ41683.1 MAG TPA: hypothetical protein [Caudoviricetes sp.]
MFDCLMCPAILLSRVFDLVLFHQLWVSQLSVRVFMVSQLKTKTREPQ